jgi:hypothetical protein
MGLRFEWIPEENEEIDLAIDDLRADLLIPAEGAAFEALDGEFQFLLQYRSRGARGVDLVVGEKVAVELGPFNQVPLLVVVSHERDFLVHPHLDGLVVHVWR